MADLLPLIYKKQRSESLSAEEMEQWMGSIISKEPPPDYQIASLLAFIFANGLNFDETAALTRAMKDSGRSFSFNSFPKDALFIDKHSTGGIGDKISIPLAPVVIAASERIHIPMIAGRGLGHTGGTIDKLESIPGMKATLPLKDFYKVLKKHRFCISGQSPEISPADRILYALRDVTGCVASIPLITASILSKKLSESLDALVLDVKFGSGAFMQDFAEAEKLARSLQKVSELQGVKSVAHLTNMDTPLGRYSGHRLEILESLAILRGEGPEDSQELTEKLGISMLKLGSYSENEARSRIKMAIESGAALYHFEQMIAAQGGKLAKFEKIMNSRKLALRSRVVKSPASGYLRWDTRKLGLALIELGAGRKRKEDKIDFDVGLKHEVKNADRVEKGQPILEIFYRTPARLNKCLRLVNESLQIEEECFSKQELIRKVIGE